MKKSVDSVAKSGDNPRSYMNMNIEISRLQGKKCPKCDGTGKLYDPDSVSKMILTFCKNNGLSQNEFGSLLDLTKGFMSNLMNGKRRWTPSMINRAIRIMETYKPLKTQTPESTA